MNLTKRILAITKQMRRFSSREVIESNFLDIQKVEKDKSLIRYSMHRVPTSSSLSSRFVQTSKSSHCNFRPSTQSFLIHWSKPGERSQLLSFLPSKYIIKEETSHLGPLAFQSVNASFGFCLVKFELWERSMNCTKQAFESVVLHVDQLSEHHPSGQIILLMCS